MGGAAAVGFDPAGAERVWGLGGEGEKAQSKVVGTLCSYLYAEEMWCAQLRSAQCGSFSFLINNYCNL